jgi:thiol-disulfide isomerase/thioredoxin
MNKKLKKNSIEYGVFFGIVAALFVTGLHTEVFGFLQRGMLKTGILKPNIEESTNAPSGPMADFSMNLINSQGEKVSMEDHKGQVIFMNIWATWCPPCIAEMPGINNLYHKMREEDEDVVFLMISVDDDFEKAKRFNTRRGFGFDVYALDGNLPGMYHSQSIPTTFVINAKGELVLTHKGMANYDTREFQNFLKSLKN